MWLPTDPRLSAFVQEYTGFCESFYARDLTEEDWRAWRQTRLSEVLARVMEGSKFYQRHLDGHPVAGCTLEDLPTLPFTTKQDLREQMFDILAGNIREATFFYETTGTTGRATPCPRDAKEVIASNYHVTKSWESIFRHHFGARAPAIGLMGPTEVHSFGDTLGDIARNVGVCNAKIWPYSPVMGFKKALELMRDLELEIICCTPGVCLNLAKAAQHYGHDLHTDFSVELFFLTGEMCTPELARTIDELWNVRTYNILYGSQEAFVIGVACEHRNMHVADPNYIVEILDPETGESMGSTGAGELCVTTLIPGVKPLIRYRTGDLVHVGPNDCGCDLPGARIDVVGRVLDRLLLNGRRYRPSEIETAVLTGLTGCAGYQVVLESDAQDVDRATVRLEFLRDAVPPAGAAAAIEARFARAFDLATSVEIAEELDPITSTGAFVSWKAARIIDKRGDDGVEERAAQRLAANRGYRT